jgi:MFS superfamily sulfate permease-like transporter
MICSVLGGLPMIAEVARSSANVNQGAKTRWSNFFHGVFVFVFLLTDIQFSGLIPYSALAAMLIGVGVKLASPKELGRMAKIGPEQLLVFCVTIAVTLFTDLLIGISIGILVKLLSQFLLGVPLKSTFKANVVVSQAHVRITGAAVFSNWLGIKRSIDQFQPSDILTIDFSQCNVVDHTVMDHMIHLENEFHHAGGTLLILGLEQLTSVSASQHPLSTRKRERANRLDHFGNSMTR